MTRVLVANRGEIAVRVVRACRRLGFEVVVAVSAADRDSLAARLADRAVCIGPADPGRSYLRPELLAQAAVSVGADVVHPGYGFCSEKPELGELLAEEGIAFAGPRPETLRAVGDKSSARREAIAADVPVSPAEDVADLAAAHAAADRIGYPALLKAVHGGGGRGIHLVREPADLDRTFDLAAAEARAGFGDGALYLERYYADARHVEVQVFGDGEGGVLVAGDRDCSVQRRHQKVLEEAPAPGLSPATRALLHDSAARLARHLRYTGAGTVEFLVDDSAGADPATVVFLEVNGRIQVEHPVTEELFGIDLVAAQLLLAAGLPTGLPESLPEPHGHVVECRVTAEDAWVGFRPSPGRITAVVWPAGPGIRVDTHTTDGYLFPPFYDSLLGKLVVRAHDRTAALDAMAAALGNARVDGIATTLDFLDWLVAQPDVRRGGVTTQWLDRVWPEVAGARTAVGAA
ncbi:acetyl-CoA carboxylase, biotin carboxylase subunit [Klenkia soli]|uniref:biotin carboxylase n=1 Tax=Klenkia soli TaxID=1052260 RepID=A0A1H0FXF0_9ACTN|nr:biotin carboxylase N-terminal domain-containing protein [Klenkia soli]SDN99346.1 acetyl-CoA carboxylase, biotin carboxylase subunit [Klenkia soli]